jgi:hypothetical protein
MARSIFSNGIELTDEELKALPIDIMAVWLEMWYEAIRDDAEHPFNLMMAERDVDNVDYTQL